MSEAGEFSESKNEIDAENVGKKLDPVIHPLAPRHRVQSDDQVDVNISPAFQALDQVKLNFLAVINLYLILLLL